MNERRIVEHALLISLLSKVAEVGSAGSGNPILTEASRQLYMASGEVMSQLPVVSREKVSRRIRSYGQRCVAPHVQVRSQIGVLGLAVHAMLEHLIEGGYLVIGENSSLSAALDILLPALEPTAEISGNMERGRVMAEAIFGSLQREGLFSGAPPIVL